MINTPQIELDLEAITLRFADCGAWEERYRQLLLLAKQLKPMDVSLKIEEKQVEGCESEVWLHLHDNKLYVDSNARIIKGLLVIVLACLNKPTKEAKALFNHTLQELGLAHHLSESRNNGISAIWREISSLD
ncbi:cysteine desulfurase, sulfur acceptor subunit CsdE [Agarivorans sp. Toyoura001]|uniref:SufE family protein n=1 Tax=Agarivorans sp. Toyoura001 TaxID=2283141 RepID=UPI0010F1B3B8|nr:SufE family protein [Agarivorans sp. Toyoura001]GDY25918.1 cysteine desulfurase, sulfur acceptor subunit CsdE [Agarivorans sp. Toyoura001]